MIYTSRLFNSTNSPSILSGTGLLQSIQHAHPLNLVFYTSNLLYVYLDRWKLRDPKMIKAIMSLAQITHIDHGKTLVKTRWIQRSCTAIQSRRYVETEKSTCSQISFQALGGKYGASASVTMSVICV